MTTLLLRNVDILQRDHRRRTKLEDLARDMPYLVGVHSAP